MDEIDAFKGSPETDERERHRGWTADGQTTQRALPNWKPYMHFVVKKRRDFVPSSQIATCMLTADITFKLSLKFSEEMFWFWECEPEESHCLFE